MLGIVSGCVRVREREVSCYVDATVGFLVTVNVPTVLETFYYSTCWYRQCKIVRWCNKVVFLTDCKAVRLF